MKNIGQWFDRNNLRLNTSKSNDIVFGAGGKSTQLPPPLSSAFCRQRQIDGRRDHVNSLLSSRLECQSTLSTPYPSQSWYSYADAERRLPSSDFAHTVPRHGPGLLTGATPRFWKWGSISRAERAKIFFLIPTFCIPEWTWNRILHSFRYCNYDV